MLDIAMNLHVGKTGCLCYILPLTYLIVPIMQIPLFDDIRVLVLPFRSRKMDTQIGKASIMQR